jgi:hypothetical protein
VDKSVRSLVTEFRWRRAIRKPAPKSCIAVALLIACLAQAAVLATRAEAQVAVDLELVIAVDVSLSMDLDEQRLQRDGYVAAFRDAELHKAITSGGHGRIAVTYMEWAGPQSQNVVVPWTVLDGPGAARAFADKLEAIQISRARLTSISSALIFSRDLFASSGAKGVRRVIDVSGDGPNNSGFPVTPIRDEVVAAGIVINGLPIMLHASVTSAFDLADLDRYYASCVIGGPGAFMIAVRHVAEFAAAIRRKLLLEISGLAVPAPIVRAQGPVPGDDYDCMAGEKQWRWYQDRWPQ